MNNIKYHKDWMHLSPSLSSLETWGFGLSGTLMWIGTAPSLQAALGIQAMLVWLPATFMGILLNLQVKRLGTQWPDMSGGTPNYATRLLKNYPGLARYAALGYFMGWASVPTINASILTNLIKTNFDALGINCPEQFLQILFTLIPYIVAFSGTRALGILHVSFLIPAVGFLAAFCIQGMEWLIFSPNSPGLIPVQLTHVNVLSLKEWTMWFFFAMYAVYDCETASSFVAESQQPSATLKCLSFAAWLMIPICIGGSWILMCLGTSAINDNTLLMFVAAAKPFWGSSTSFLVTFLIVCSSLLTSATAVANSPRVIYQLALDKHVAPVFAVVSRQGVLEPGLILTLILSCIYLLWGDFNRIVLITAVGFLPCIMAVHLGLWLRRDKPYVLFPRLALCFFIVEVVVLLVGGWGWGWQNLVTGLLLPFGVMAVDFAMRRSNFAPFHPAWWISRYKRRFHNTTPDFVLLQVGTLLFLVCGATVVSWVLRGQLIKASENTNADLLVVLLLCVAFVAVGIACWTSLPQVNAIAVARKQAELSFQIALDAIVVVDNQGVICSCNLATEKLFQTLSNDLIGLRLNTKLTQLAQNPEDWDIRSEQTLNHDSENLRFVEVAISESLHQEQQEYVVIIRDITSSKLARQALQESEERFRQIAESINQVFWMIDIEIMKTIYISPAYESIWGRTCQSLYQESKSFINAIHPEDRSRVIAALTQVSTLPYDQEYRIIRPDGTERWIRDRAFPICDRKGKVYRVAGVAEDITLAKEAASALRQSEARLREQTTQLEQALRNLQHTQAQLIQSEKMSSLGQLVAGVAHEINNPVNFIYGNLDCTHNYFRDLLTLIKLYQQGYLYTDPKVQTFVSSIDLDFLLEDVPKILASMKIGSERIREIVLTLRNFSRLDEAEMKPVNIHEGIDSTLLILQSRLKAQSNPTNIEIIKEYGDLPQVECYAGQLNQVFMNILSNAIDAFDNYSQSETIESIEKNKCKITIRTQIINSDWVGICIFDNGSGIAEAIKQKLFDPFFTTKPVGKGTGLGLSISYKIVVEKHNGQLRCISTPGEGSEFIIEIPIRQSLAVDVKL